MDQWKRAVTGRQYHAVPYGDHTAALFAAVDLVSENPHTSHNSFLDMEGPIHQLLRRTVSAYLRRGVDVQQVVRQVHDHIDRFTPPGDLVAAVVHPVVSDVVFDVFEVPKPMRPDAAALLYRAMGGLDPRRTDARDAMSQLILHLFRWVSRPANSGLFAELSDLARDGAITKKQAVAGMLTAIHGGHENPVLMVGAYLAALLAGEQPDSASVVEVYGPVRSVIRHATVDREVAGCPVAAGDGVQLFLGDDQRRALPFGWGRHSCPGALVAQQIAAAFTVVEGLDRRFETVRSTTLETYHAKGVHELFVTTRQHR